jgi:hypothetical protein
MFDINTAINTAIAAAVEQAITPLVERIKVLEVTVTVLETKLAEAALFTQTTNVTVPVDEARMVEALNSQEWFWEKIGRFVDGKVEAGLEEHCSTYDHDEYDNVVNAWGSESPDEFVKDADLRGVVQDIVNDASFEVTVRL